MKPLCSIFFHNYYGCHKDWMDFFVKNINFPANLYYNITEDSLYNIESAETPFYYNFSPGPDDPIKKIIARQSPNQGKDIGGKMILLDAYQKLAMPTKFGLFLHDKKSPYKANNQTWANNLFSVAANDFSKKALQLLEANPDIGIITANGNVKDEYDYDTNSFRTTNKSLLPELQDLFTIYPASFKYVAGTMFWFRMQPISAFFEKHPPLKIREMLEKGNVMDEYSGSYTHSWERLLCWIITGQNYSIKTI